MSEPDWTIVEDPEVQRVIQQAAAKVAEHYGVDADDLTQEASLRVCDLSTDLPECVLRDEPQYGLLQYRLEQDLSNLAMKEVRPRNRATSYEDRYEEAFEDDRKGASNGSAVAIRTEVSSYTTELVESLLPAVWDDSYCYGLRAENAPDPDMPRGTINKATGNTVGALIVDVKRAWEGSALTHRERQALFATFGTDWTQEYTAKALGVSRHYVSEVKVSGVKRMADWLNGKAT